MAEEHTILEDSRAAAIQSAANFLEAIAKAKALSRQVELAAGGPPKFGPPPAGQGDLLFDWMRLQATYLNRLTELGTTHRTLAFRALENLYSLFEPRARAKPASTDDAPASEKASRRARPRKRPAKKRSR